MYICRKAMTLALVAAFALIGGCSQEAPRGNERWVTTQNTNVPLDWNKINEAYKQAEGPTDFEKRVNEIYEGDEVISVAVQDVDEKTQEVTGFFDKNTNGQVDGEEKIFTIKRDVVGEGSGQYQIQGHGPYYGYHSPMLSIATGMILGSMLSSALRPGYAPVYTQPYVTSSQRAGELRGQRNQYRAANPSKFTRSKASGTGRTYNSKGTRSWGGSGGRSSGGARFGIRRQRPRDSKPERLTA